MLTIQIDTLNKTGGFLPLIVNDHQTVWLGPVQPTREAAYQLATAQLQMLSRRCDDAKYGAT
jgi:hypothetical protein